MMFLLKCHKCMDDLNLHLQILIKEACMYPKNTPQHRKAINNLLRSLLKSRRIWRPAAGNDNNKDIYEEALQKTLVDLSSKTLCEKYNPEQGLFLPWFNRCLENKYIMAILPFLCRYIFPYTRVSISGVFICYF